MLWKKVPNYVLVFVLVAVSIFVMFNSHLVALSTSPGLAICCSFSTDADVDGMHIRLLLITFFLQFFPELIRHKHLYILQTPLFRVRNKKETIYCYSEEEKLDAIKKLGTNPEITRFKGLGEISPEEFKHFIGKDIRIEPVLQNKGDVVPTLLELYMDKNNHDRQNFIIDN